MIDLGGYLLVLDAVVEAAHLTHRPVPLFDEASISGSPVLLGGSFFSGSSCLFSSGSPGTSYTLLGKSPFPTMKAAADSAPHSR